MPHERHGPTTKADCLNTLYAALERDQQHCGYHARMVVLHDAEDMVDPAALAVFDRALEHAEFIQLPVLPEVQASSRWVGSHYCDEFAELNWSLSQRASLRARQCPSIDARRAAGRLGLTKLI